jgi:hypothetical protein
VSADHEDEHAQHSARNKRIPQYKSEHRHYCSSISLVPFDIREAYQKSQTRLRLSWVIPGLSWRRIGRSVFSKSGPSLRSVDTIGIRHEETLLFLRDRLPAALARVVGKSENEVAGSQGI